MVNGGSLDLMFVNHIFLLKKHFMRDGSVKLIA